MSTRPLKLLSQRAMSIPEASAVACLGGGRFLVVDDERGVFAVDLEGRRRRLIEGNELRDPEGIALTADRRHVLLLEEESGQLLRYQVIMKSSGPELAGRQHVGALEQISQKKGSGWEGIAIAHQVPWLDEDRLLAVHQRKPRRLSVFPLPTPLPPTGPGEPAATLDALTSWSLPEQLRESLSHLNDVAIHPESGNVFILSGKAALVAELSVSRRRSGLSLELECLHELPETKGVPEGITFSDDGTLWAVTDGAGLLLELRLRG